jgi:hypothetical protein
LLADHDNSVIVYPKVAIGGETSRHGHHELAFTFFQDQKCAGNYDIGTLLGAIGDEAGQSDRNILISSEVLETRDVGAFIGALLQHIPSPIDVEILFTCREHFSRAASLYNHRLRAKRSPENRSPDKFLAEFSSKMCYAPLARGLRDTGFPVTALNYHPSTNWVQRFLTYVGFPEHEIPEITNELVSHSPKMLVVNLAVKHAVRSRDAQLKVLKAFRQMPGKHATSRFIFGHEAALAAEKAFSTDRQFMREEFGLELVPPDLTMAPNGLVISEGDLGDIISAAKNLGSRERQAIIEFARQYVH